MVEVRRLFATPFAYEMLPDTIDLGELRAAIARERERDPAGMQVSNLGGWHSNTAMLEWGGPGARALADKAAAMADSLTLDTARADATALRWNAEMWANVASAGHANQYHFHPGWFWSAVAYLDDGYEGSEDDALGGELQLLDPRLPGSRMAAPAWRVRDADGAEQHGELKIRPRTGLLVLFPSWLQHAVRPFHGTGERVSVALNLVPIRQEG